MSGLSVKLPLARDIEDGFALNKKFAEIASQNLNHLILTIPGEKIMDPEFGVGIKKYLFEQNTFSTRSDISSQIRRQAARYLPYITIEDIQFGDTEAEMDSSTLSVAIFYNITPIDLADILIINVDLTT